MQVVGSEKVNTWKFEDEADQPHLINSESESSRTINTKRDVARTLLRGDDEMDFENRSNKTLSVHSNDCGEISNANNTQRNGSTSGQAEVIQTHHGRQVAPMIEPAPALQSFQGVKKRKYSIGSEIFICTDASYVFSRLSNLVKHELRWKILKKLQGSTKSPQTNLVASQHMCTVDVSCSMCTFESIATSLNEMLLGRAARNLNTERNHFFPSFHAIKEKSMSSNRFDILLDSFNEVCEVLGLREEDDYEKMICEETQTSSDYSSTLVGSIVEYDGDDFKFARILLGLSGFFKVHDQSSDHDSESVPKTCVVFEQEQADEAWDEENQLFLTKWRSKKLSLHPVHKVLHTSDTNSTSPCFRLSWKRMSAPSKSKWSIDALHVGSDVLGTLSLVILMVHIQGTTTCNHISNLLDAHIEEIISSRRT